MGNSLLPIAFVVAAIFPTHLAVPLPHIVFELPLVYIPICPLELPHPVFLIPSEVPLVYVALCVYPGPLSLPQPLHKLPLVLGSVLPEVLPISVRVSVVIESLVPIAIVEVLLALSVFDELGEVA